MAEKIKFRCESCNWKFTRNYRPGLCPYCGRATVTEDTLSDATDIVREVENLGK